MSHDSSAEDVQWQIPLCDVEVDAELLAAVAEVVRSGWWSMGPRVESFEHEFSEFCGAQHAIAVANGTAALHLALLAVGCGEGDEVVVPSLNFVAAANTIVHTGAVPVFCDVQGVHDLTMDPDDLDAAIGPRAKAVVVMHYGGFPCDMDAIGEIAARHGLVVVEDAAHTPGATYGARSCGTIGAVGCFSFFANKNLPTGEGGMIVTDDDELAQRMRLLRSHGMTSLTWDRHRGHAQSYDVVAHGLNYRLDELRATIGSVELRRLGAMNGLRSGHWQQYRELLDGVSDIAVPFAGRSDASSSAHHLAVIVLPAEASRVEVQTRLRERGIATSVHYPPIHRFTAFANRSNRSMPRTDDLAPRVLTLPLYPHMEERDVSHVASELLDAVGSAAR